MLNAAEKLKEKSLKVTPQRIAIYNMLRHTDSHPTAEAIYKSLSESHPFMSLATIYKTLDALKRADLIEELNVGEDSFRYDANIDPHHHMICRCCGQVYDHPILSSMPTLEEEIKKDTDFKVETSRLYFYGVCKNCQE